MTPAAIWAAQLPPAAKLVLLYYALAADDAGQVQVPVPTVASACSLARSTVRAILAQLCAEGWLARVAGPRQHAAALYRLLEPARPLSQSAGNRHSEPPQSAGVRHSGAQPSAAQSAGCWHSELRQSAGNRHSERPQSAGYRHSGAAAPAGTRWRPRPCRHRGVGRASQAARTYVQDLFSQQRTDPHERDRDGAAQHPLGSVGARQGRREAQETHAELAAAAAIAALDPNVRAVLEARARTALQQRAPGWRHAAPATAAAMVERMMRQIWLEEHGRRAPTCGPDPLAVAQ